MKIIWVVCQLLKKYVDGGKQEGTMIQAQDLWE